MTQARGNGRAGGIPLPVAILAIAIGVGESCRQAPGVESPSGSTTLRVGLGQVSATNPVSGLRQLSQRLMLEGLARTADDGRMVPSLAASWTVESGGRALSAKLRPDVRFHDGSAATADAVDEILPSAFKAFMGPMLSSEIVDARPASRDTIHITFREPSQFAVESLEAPIQKADGVGTGAFKASPSTTELVSNDDYYLGAPTIKRVRVDTFPSTRAAWAELLRGRIDMLYEVGTEALASLENSSTIAIFTYTRPYQYVLVLNSRTPALASVAIRQALNMSVNRADVVRNALNGYGVASDGPIWPKHWALQADHSKPAFNPEAATRALGTRLRLSCLVPPDALTERVALEVKRQLAAVGVDMKLDQVSFDELATRAGRGQYEALLIEVISGQTIFRPYLVWYSKSPLNYGRFGTSTSDAALDRVRHAQSEDEYRGAVAGLQRNFIDDPPAIFLAWSVRARAISRRFTVPAVESGRDVLSTIRLWKPATGDLRASRN